LWIEDLGGFFIQSLSLALSTLLAAIRLSSYETADQIVKLGGILQLRRRPSVMTTFHIVPSY